jgi:hypothetical protein
MIIQGLWIGNDLTQYEYSSIQSFINNGFEYHLYVYNNIGNIPKDCIIKDARDILPETDIFLYENSFAPFSDLFRYKLLFTKGNYWADCDCYCLHPFEIKEDYLFVAERTIKQGAFKSILPYKPLNSFIGVLHSGNSFFEMLYNDCNKYKNDYLEQKINIKVNKNVGMTSYHWKGGG